jgi:NAD-dependent deacetylase
MQMWTSWCESYKSVAQKNNRQQFKEEKKKGWIHMGNNDSSVETFLQWIKASDNIVFFGGAGVSTESGIPDFRSVDGLYNQKYDYPPETILSHTFYRKHPQEFYRFYRDKMLCLDAEPNITHYKLAELEKAGKLKGVVTQNIDGLHQKAGSKNVMELHGSVLRNYCERCLQFVSAEEILNSTDVPKCPKCGGPVKPDVVLYEEGLNQKTLEDAIYYISHADVLIVGGTSLAVYPAAGLIDYYNGNKLVLINKSTTPMDARADLLIQQGLGSVFEQIEV